MEIALTRQRLVYAERVHNETRRAEETAEMIVPDALPDILRIVDTDADITVRAKEVTVGRATITGNAAVTVIYAPDGEAGLRRVTLDLPFSIAAENTVITAASRFTARVSLDNIAASAVNPRKIAANTTVRAELAVYNNAVIELPSGVAEGEGAEIELFCDHKELTLETDVREKTFVVTDEFQISASNPPIGELLKSNIALRGTDTKVVGSKLIFKGTAHVNLLYIGTGGELTSDAFATEFSQIMELENASADSEFVLIPLLANASIMPNNVNGADSRRVLTELHIVAQAVAHTRMEFSFIGDAYGSRFALEAEHSKLSFTNNLGPRAASAVLRGTLNAPELSRIVSISAKPGTVEQSAENSALALRCPIRVDALYIASDGTVRTATQIFELDASLSDANARSSFSVYAEASRDVYGVAADDEIELRIPVEFRAEETRLDTFSPISALNMEEDAPLDLLSLPSLVISRLSNAPESRNDAQRELWLLAKRHHSTRELILQANSLEDEASLRAAESLIIPKKR